MKNITTLIFAFICFKTALIASEQSTQQKILDQQITALEEKFNLTIRRDYQSHRYGTMILQEISPPERTRSVNYLLRYTQLDKHSMSENVLISPDGRVISKPFCPTSRIVFSKGN